MDDADVKSDKAPVGRWCLVANVVPFREWRPEKQVRSGTRHFSGGAKVYCDRTTGGLGFDAEFGTISVLGRHRGSGGRNWIQLYMKVRFLHNFRVSCEYSPSIRYLLDHRYRFTLGGYNEGARSEAETYAKRGNAMAAQCLSVTPGESLAARQPGERNSLDDMPLEEQEGN
jgi:hypothetical protein